MATIRTRLYPFHDVSDHNKINLFSLNTDSGLAGQLVKIVTGAANPQNADGWSNTSVGASIDSTVSFRYEAKMKIAPTVSGDTKYNALGITLFSTLEEDDNGLKLKYYPQRAKEIGAVVSGEAVPVATQGVFGIWGKYIDQTTSAVQPGNLVVVSRSGNGTLASADPTVSTVFNNSGVPTSATFIYEPKHVVGKWLTSLPTATNTGLQNEFSAQGGYALFQLTTHA
jgi:hypothetical protein